MSQSRRVSHSITTQPTTTATPKSVAVVDEENIYRTEQYEDEDGYDR